MTIPNVWKLATIAVSTVALGALAWSYIENRQLTAANTALDARLNSTRTELAQANTNTAQLQVAIADQRVKFERRAADDARVLAETRQRLADAQTATRAAQTQVADLLRQPPQGSTVCEQYEDIDRRGLGVTQ